MNIRNHLIEIQCSHRDVNDVAQALIHSIIFFRTHGKFNYKREGSYSIGTLGFERAFCDNFDFTYIRCSALSLVSRINNKVQEFADRIHEFTHSATITLEFFNKRPSRWPFNDSKIVWELWNIKIFITPPTTTATAIHQPLHASPPSPSQHSQQQQSSPSLATAATSVDTHHRQQYQQRKSESTLRLEDLLSHKLLDIVKIVNSEKCSLPQMPTQPNLDTVFDTSFSDLQPYLYNISYKINEIAPGSHSMVGGGIGSGGGGGGGTSSGFGGSGSAIGGGIKYSESSGGTAIDASAQSSLKKFLLGTLEL